MRNAASDDLQTTQRDVKTWGKLIPLNNTALVLPFLTHSRMTSPPTKTSRSNPSAFPSKPSWIHAPRAFFNGIAKGVF